MGGWFDLSAAEMRRRPRPNLVVSGVEPFWEDRRYADPERVVGFRVGDATSDGVNPCRRCVVPARDPETGEETSGSREQFVERREATLPAWADREQFDYYVRLMVSTRVPAETVGADVAVGDEVEILDERER